MGEEQKKEFKTYEQGLKEGLEEAWEIARKIVLDTDIYKDNYDIDEIKEIFGDGRYSRALANYSIHEAKAKIEAWEAEKNKPKLGDVVEIKMHGVITGIFLAEDCDEYWILDSSWNHNIPQRIPKSRVARIAKTGEHVNIQGMLDKLRENE